MASHKLIEAGKKGARSRLHCEGLQKRDFMFLEAAAQTYTPVAFAGTNSASIFDKGGSSPVSMNSALLLIEEIMNLGIEIEIVPLDLKNPIVIASDFIEPQMRSGWKPKNDTHKVSRAAVEWQVE